jgi:sporulation protein YlmC with PRC-barrel domain
MRNLVIAALTAGLFATAAVAQTAPGLLTTAPANSTTITNYHKQNVYDQGDNKIGEIMDVLVGQDDGRINALVIGVGGFLGMGEKDVLVSFPAVKHSMKDNKWYLVMNTTKDALKAAPGFKYDRTKMTWVAESNRS